MGDTGFGQHLRAFRKAMAPILFVGGFLGVGALLGPDAQLQSSQGSACITVEQAGLPGQRRQRMDIWLYRHYRAADRYCEGRIAFDRGITRPKPIGLSTQVEPVEDFEKTGGIKFRSSTLHALAYAATQPSPSEVPLRIGKEEIVPNSRLLILTTFEGGLWAAAVAGCGMLLASFAYWVNEKTEQRQNADASA